MTRHSWRLSTKPASTLAGVAEAIEAADATLIYLRKYSPDLNPIELAFSKLKTHLRKAAEHTVPHLLRRIGRVVTDFSAPGMQEFPSPYRLCLNLTGICFGKPRGDERSGDRYTAVQI